MCVCVSVWYLKCLFWAVGCFDRDVRADGVCLKGMLCLVCGECCLCGGPEWWMF